MEDRPGRPQDLGVLERLIQILDGLGIPYAIGGSLASSAYGAARFTQDADIMVAPFADRAQAFLRQVAAEFYVSEEALQHALRKRGSFNLIHLESAFKIDIFVQEDTAFARQVLEHRTKLIVPTLESTGLDFVSPEDIVLLKLRWYQQGGEVSEHQWRDVQGVLAVQQDSLDLDYLRQWASALGLSDLLERALDEAGAA